jgi:hypothetical protein
MLIFYCWCFLLVNRLCDEVIRHNHLSDSWTTQSRGKRVNLLLCSPWRNTAEVAVWLQLFLTISIFLKYMHPVHFFITQGGIFLFLHLSLYPAVPKFPNPKQANPILSLVLHRPIYRSLPKHISYSIMRPDVSFPRFFFTRSFLNIVTPIFCLYLASVRRLPVTTSQPKALQST